MSENTQRTGSVPNRIDPREYPALEDLRPHCRRGGHTMIDRVYAEALKMHQRLKEAEDLAGLSEPVPKPKKAIWTPAYANPDTHNLEPVREPSEGEDML